MLETLVGVHSHKSLFISLPPSSLPSAYIFLTAPIGHQSLTGAGFERPRNGQKNDKAHPPIHPTAHVSDLTGDDKKVYDLVTRRFLACCSRNARGLESTVEIKMAEELFSATGLFFVLSLFDQPWFTERCFYGGPGLIVTETNYLDVYIYDKWTGNLLPQFEEGEKFKPTTLEVKEGKTTRPNLLTEADLVSLMDKNGIGSSCYFPPRVFFWVSKTNELHLLQ